jgi:hypothetical protein
VGGGIVREGGGKTSPLRRDRERGERGRIEHKIESL